MADLPAYPLLADCGATSDFEYIQKFLKKDHGFSLLQKFRAELSWQQQEIRLFGRKILQPRLSCWYGDQDAAYAYSGLRLEPLPWHPDLLVLRHLLQETLQYRFNSVLANAYRDGRDSMGWHADDEKELGAEPLIASLSLGAPRRFLLRSRNGGETASLLLEHGSLLLMRGTSQKYYKHSIPKTAKPAGLRINLTFRHVSRD